MLTLEEIAKIARSLRIAPGATPISPIKLKMHFKSGDGGMPIHEVATEKVHDDHYTRMEHAAKAAKEKGLVIVLPKANELFIDIDDAEGLARFEKFFPKVRELIEVERHHIRPSPSGEKDHYHITVVFAHALFDYERIALQAILGSDPMREVLSWQRQRNGQENPTLFFERPEDLLEEARVYQGPPDDELAL